MSLPLVCSTIPGISKAKKIIGVASGKGGVGKSTVAVHIACALAKLGNKVGLLDADLYGPSLHKMVREKQLPQQQKEAWIPAYSFTGIAMMTLAYFKEYQNGAAVRAPIANRLITSFLHHVAWGELDWLVVDFPPGTGDIHLTLVQNAPFLGAILVTTPQEIAILDVAKAFHLFQKAEIPILGLIENMSYYSSPTSQERLPLFGEGGGRRFSMAHQILFLGELPLDPALSHAADQGIPLIEDKPDSLTTQMFMQMALLLSQTPSISKNEQAISLSEDGKTFHFQVGGIHLNLSSFELQQSCPCALCKKNSSSLKDVVCLEIISMGNYGMRFRFSSGCSHGIYPFLYIKEIFGRK